MHDEALTKEAAEIFPILGKFASFYLVGGTALAFQIGHRVSVDFDLFCESELPHDLLQKIRRMFPDTAREVTLRTPEQTNMLINGVKTTFFSYPYPVVLPLVEYRGMRMASLGEIAAMKAFAIGKRLSYKDYVDWFFLLRNGHADIKGTIAIAQEKYHGDFNDRLFLEQLASLSDVASQEIAYLRDPIDRETIETFLEKTVREYALSP